LTEYHGVLYSYDGLAMIMMSRGFIYDAFVITFMSSFLREQ